MRQLRGDADVVIDTTALNVHQLKAKVARAVRAARRPALRVTVVSFGFKYGVPVDADLLADMRFLPNPFWVPELRHAHRPGRRTWPTTSSSGPRRETFLDQYVPVIETVGEGYLREGKRFMTVAIGCTGGKHRSVAMAEEIAPGSASAASRPGRPTATWGASELVDRTRRWSRWAAGTASRPPWPRCAGSPPTSPPS